MPHLDPLVFLFGGLGLLAASLVVLVLNREAAHAENPYDSAEQRLGLDAALWSIRNADVQYHDGLALGRRFPGRGVDALAAGLNKLNIGRFEIVSGKRRYEVRVRDGLFARAPVVDESLCYLTLGILKGGFERALGREVRVEEETCTGSGHPECVFNVEVIERDATTTFTRV